MPGSWRCCDALTWTGEFMSARLILVCSNYPFTGRAGEVMFVAPEVERLARVLGSVCIAPQHAQGAALALPRGVELDLGLARALRRQRVVSYLLAPIWPGFFGELWRALRCGGFAGCARVWRWAAYAQVTWRWARARTADGAPLLFATYWRGGSTLALVRLAARRAHTAVITRVHGHELYAERWRPAFQPWLSMYDALALVVPVSRHGYDYLVDTGVAPACLWLSRLGVEASAPARASDDGRVRVVSCSAMVPLKRVPLVAHALCEFTRRLPGLQLCWTHFGAGPDMSEVRAILRTGPPNLQTDLPGQVENASVLRHYVEQPVDLFMLLSKSEGLPVSIQEACAAGIPVLATDVGGVAEIVGADNGMLLADSPTVEDVVAALRRLCVDAGPQERARMRARARARWAAEFDAERNHLRFAQRLREMMDTL